MQAKVPSHFGNTAGMIDPADEFQHNLYDLLPGLIFIYDLESNMLRYANKKARQLVGLSEKELHADLQTIIYRDDLPTVNDALTSFAKLNIDDDCGFVCRINTREGTAVTCQVAGKVIERNHARQPTVIWLMAQEVKGQGSVGVRHQDGLDMVVEKERFLGQGTWEMDLDSRIATWSDGMYHLFGYDPETDRGHLIINEALYHKHLSTQDYDKGKALRKSALEKDDSYVWEYEIRTTAGETKQLETFGKVIRDPNGEPRKVIGTTRDVTKMVNYERELERKITELKRSNKDLEDFAYMASHDMHEPLRKIFSFADRLQSRHSASLPEEANGYIARILSSTQNARAMIDGLMQFSRLSTKGHWFEKVRLNDVLAEVLADLEIPIDETKAKIDAGSLPEMDAIRTQIKQLFTNLILNALKFRKPDVTPEISIRSKKLTRAEVDELNLGLNKVFYKITVQDNGIGFEEEYKELVFQMFQRLNSKGEYPGAGIGLALCKKIAENHQGIIHASSNLGKGTVISVIIPSNLSRNA